MTACVTDEHRYSTGYVLKFDDIRTQTGIISISSFKSSGKFTCQKEGLYLISSWVFSDTNFATFGVYRSSKKLAQGYITFDSDDNTSAGTGTAVISVELQVADTVYVKTENDMRAFDGMRSCLTIVKLK